MGSCCAVRAHTRKTPTEVALVVIFRKRCHGEEGVSIKLMVLLLLLRDFLLHLQCIYICVCGRRELMFPTLQYRSSRLEAGRQKLLWFDDGC